MITAFFHRNIPIQLILLVLVCILAWMPMFLAPPVMMPAASLSPLYNLLFIVLGTTSPLLLVITAFVLHLLTALAISWLFSSSVLLPRPTLLPSFLYAGFTLCIPGYLSMNPAILALPGILLAMFFILKIYQQPGQFKLVFSAGFTLSIASMLYFPVSLISLILFISFLIYRIASWREWIISLTGFLVPYAWFFFFLFMADKLEIVSAGYISEIHQFNRLSNTPGSALAIFWILLAAVGLPSVIHLLSTLNENVISFRKMSLVMIWLGALSLLSYIHATANPVIHSALVYFPLTFYISRFVLFKKWRKKWLPEILLLVLACGIAVNMIF